MDGQLAFVGQGLSRTSDLYGYWKCHDDVGNIIDHVLQGIQASCLSDAYRKR